MAVNDRPLKRTKRNRVTADLYDFLTFPHAGGKGSSEGPFRENVKIFLSRHARLAFPPSLFPCLLAWQISFRVGDLAAGSNISPFMVVLHIVEEDVARSSRSIYCNHCRVVGWSGNPVCRKRYHFIIRADSDQEEGYQGCIKCGNLLSPSESRCRWCDMVMTKDDVEEWVYSQFEDTSHLLHGIVHSNGFGHLVVVKGREGGSKVLTGTDIMNFWDRLCASLAARKVSVMDVSVKYGMDYRLLLAVARGHSWYHSWGYEFGCGSYALTMDAYQKAVHAISNLRLSPLLFCGRKRRTRLQGVISFYRSISDVELATLKDLFSFLLRLLDESHFHSKPKPGGDDVECCIRTNALCAWSREDVKRVQQKFLRVMMVASKNTNWVTRRSLKGIFCKSETPELLDYCLQCLGERKVTTSGDMVIQTRINPDSSYDVEFRAALSSPSGFAQFVDGLESTSRVVSRDDLKRDLKFLYDNLLDPETMASYGDQETRRRVMNSANMLLDCKQFMKDYGRNAKKTTMTKDSSSIQIACYLQLSDQIDVEQQIPPEFVILPCDATVSDLKKEAAKAFQEVYAMFRKFEVDGLPEYGSLSDFMTLRLLLGPCRSVRMRAACLSKNMLNHFKRERGIETWTVDCICGARDDDGEKMLACDSCGVWQHTRCAGIDNSHGIPTKYLCSKCISGRRKGDEDDEEADRSRNDVSDETPVRSTCRGDTRGTDRIGIEATLIIESIVR